MPKRLGSAERLLIYQRRYEPSRVQQQFWSEAYEQVVPAGRRPQAKRDAPASCGGKEARQVSLTSDSREVKCA
jgi:hypothetical protein